MRKLAVQIIAFFCAFGVHFIQSNWAIARTMQKYGVEADYWQTYTDRFEIYLVFSGGLLRPLLPM